ncbi:MAG TPA: MFS transporter [Spirochaetota bacterium]|nr:MFS transporter [Spirochaetota bacterium]
MQIEEQSKGFPGKAGAGLRKAFRSLKYRNYRLFFMGQAVSLIGTWMQQVAVSWLAYRLTGSAIILGTVAFCAQIPVFILSPFTGALGDRLNRRNILFATQIFSMIQSFIFFVLTFTGIITTWHIVVLSLALGVINSFEMPTRQAFLLEMVDDKRDLPNAIALNSAAFNSSRLIGPAIAGIVVAFSGEAVCFAVNSASYFASAAALMMMRFAPAPAYAAGKLFDDIKEGFRYVRGNRLVRDLLIVVAFTSFFSMMFPVLLPIFAREVLKGDSHTFGFLVSAAGAGALAATMFLAIRTSIKGLWGIINACMMTLAAAFMLLSVHALLVMVMIFLALAGFSTIVVIASCNTILQTVSDSDKRGRVISFYIMAFTGAAPLGSLAAGYVSHRIGAPWTFLCAGVVCLAAGILILFRRKDDDAYML